MEQELAALAEKINKNTEALALHSQSDHEYQQEDTKQKTEMLSQLAEINKKLDPIVDAYKALLFNKNFLTGLGSVIVGIMAIGAAAIWLFDKLVHP